jgi:hypothetical protein
LFGAIRIVRGDRIEQGCVVGKSRSQSAVGISVDLIGGRPLDCNDSAVRSATLPCRTG